MKLIWTVFNKFIKLTSGEMYSSEEHFIYLYETSKVAEKIDNSNCVRKVQRDDRFISNYFKRLSETFLERGEIGLGYYFNDVLAGFIWVRPGGFPEQLGRETVIIPKNYALLHHLVVETEYQGKGIGTMLLNEFSLIASSYKISKIIAFIRKGNIPSVKTFTSVGFVQHGLISSRRYLGKRVVTINSSGIPLDVGPISEYRSIIARSINFPIKILSTPYIYQEETLIDGVIGGRPWLSILAATVLHDSIPGVIKAVPEVGTPVLIPCSISQGRKPGRLRINIEPTLFQPWPNINEHTYREVISSIARVSQSRSIETLNWPLPFWVINDLLGMKLPDGCSLERRNDSSWVIDIDGYYENIENKFSKTARNYIRQAEKRGVVICDNPTKEDLNIFADLWLLSYKQRKWSGFQYNKLYFLALDKYIKNGANIILAKVNGKVVSGGVFVRDKLGYVYLLGTVDRDYDDYRPMYAVINHMVRKAVKLEMKYINLGGTGGLDSLVSFKRHWGAQPKESYWLRCTNLFPNESTSIRFTDKMYERLIRYYLRALSYRFRNIISRNI